MVDVKRLRDGHSLRIATEADAMPLRDACDGDIVSALLSNGQPAYAAGLDGALIYSNNAYGELLDAARKARLADRDRRRDSDHDEDALFTPGALERVQNEQEPVWIEEVIEAAPSSHSSSHRYRGLHFPIHDQGGNVIAVGGVYYEISREHALSLRAGLAQDRYDDLTRLISDWIWETDRDFNLTYVSPRIMESCGIHPSLLLGTNLFEFGRFMETGRGTPNRNSRSPFRDKLFHIKGADGEVRQCRLGGMPVFDSQSGNFNGFRGTGNDITDQLEANARASAAQVRLGDAIESISEAIALFDSDHCLVECNEKFREYHPAIAALLAPGMSFEKIIRAGADSGQFMQGKDNPDAWVDAEIERQRNHQGAYEQQLSDGRWLKVSHRRTDDGGIISLRTDITEFKRREAALREAEAAAMNALEAAELANRAKSEFLANMSHELRTPLNAINGFSEIIMKEMFGPLSPARYMDYIKDIHDSGTHLYSLINDVLDVSKVEVGKVELHLNDVDIHNAMTRCLRLVSDRAENGKLTITFDVSEDLPLFKADERKLLQIVINLLSNAVKFTPEGGGIILSAAIKRRGDLVISVEDNGIGIAPENMETVMAPFGQVDSSLARRYEGTGLGMSLTKSLIELHGGTMKVDSALGVGTKVTVRLPAKAPRTT